jgi:hypothetical protein
VRAATRSFVDNGFKCRGIVVQQRKERIRADGGREAVRRRPIHVCESYMCIRTPGLKQSIAHIVEASDPDGNTLDLVTVAIEKCECVVGDDPFGTMPIVVPHGSTRARRACVPFAACGANGSLAALRNNDCGGSNRSSAERSSAVGRETPWRCALMSEKGQYRQPKLHPAVTSATWFPQKCGSNSIVTPRRRSSLAIVHPLRSRNERGIARAAMIPSIDQRRFSPIA